ncbi:MAG: cyclic nucleotide-binding domain-containing protein, partial [Bdellovibrionaceae bacterium]|nr:cyclic nucleotide-binding domain-containing protein [Pseudobdellovibrionaceae bacterium]
MRHKVSAEWRNLLFNHVTATPFEKKISRGEFVYRAGDEAKRLYLVKSGLVGLVLYGPTGNEHLLRLFKPGDYFGHR